MYVHTFKYLIPCHNKGVHTISEKVGCEGGGTVHLVRGTVKPPLLKHQFAARFGGSACGRGAFGCDMQLTCTAYGRHTRR